MTNPQHAIRLERLIGTEKRSLEKIDNRPLKAIKGKCRVEKMHE